MIQRLTTPSSAEIEIEGRTLINFGGCCYLGLSGVNALADAGVAALRNQFGGHAVRKS